MIKLLIGVGDKVLCQWVEEDGTKLNDTSGVTSCLFLTAVLSGPLLIPDSTGFSRLSPSIEDDRFLF
jgi:hypothetical protein